MLFFKKNSLNPPDNINKKAHLVMCFLAGGEGWIRLIAERANRVCKSEASTQTNCAIALCVLHTRHFVYICLLCPLRTISANATRLRPSLRSTLRQRRKCANVQLHATLRVMFACYVHYARFPQMLRACVPLCLRSAPKGGSTRNACWLFFF